MEIQNIHEAYVKNLDKSDPHFEEIGRIVGVKTVTVADDEDGYVTLTILTEYPNGDTGYIRIKKNNYQMLPNIWVKVSFKDKRPQ